MRIGLFSTCLVDGLFPDVGRATVTLLERLGHDVEVPLQQTCCGQMHINTGYLPEALPLIRNYVETFVGYDVIVVPQRVVHRSIRHQHADVARELGDPQLAHAARVVAERTYELSELLLDVLGVTEVGAYFPHRVTYRPTCHSLRRRARHRPGRAARGRGMLRLRRNVRVEEPGRVDRHAADKMSNVLNTRAEVCAAGDSSCLTHIGGGLSRLQTGVRTVHLAEILAAT